MRKFIYILIVALLSMNVFAIEPTITAPKINADDWSGSLGRDRAWRWAIAIENAVEAMSDPPLGTGTALYVDSGVANEGDGSSWLNAKDTIEEAYDLCDGNAGDIIYVANAHEETLGTLVLDTEGVTIVGIGKGEDRPEITWDGTGDIITISGASNTIVNLSFRAGVHAITTGISITGGGDYTTIYGCDFPEPSTDTFDFITGILLATGADYVTIANCTYKHADAVGPAEFIEGGDGAVNGLAIIGNYVYGEFSAAAIFSDQTDLEVYIAYNTITNMTNNLYAIQLGTNATGWLIGNVVSTDTYATGIEAGACGVDNDTVWVDYGLTDVVAVPYYTNNTGVNRWGVTELAQIEGEAIDALEADSLDKLMQLDGGSHTYPDSPANESVIAYILSKSATAATSSYDNTEHSLEAIGDKIDALTGVGFRGTVTTTTDTTTINSTDLAGFGADYFNTGWYAIVTYDQGAAGAAPEGDVRDIVNYTDAGVFTVDPAFGGTMTSGDKVMIVRVEDMNFDSIATLGGSGRIVYVDSGVAGTADVGDLGDTWDLAYPTLTAALDAITDDNGDVIYVAAGHEEDISGAYAINDAGVKIIGLGDGDEQPMFEFTATSSQFDVTVSDVMFENCRFAASTSDVVAGIDIADGGDGFHLKNCRFTSVAAADEFLIMINLQADADDVLIEGCKFLTPGAAATEGIYFAGVTDNFQFLNNYMQGDWTVAAMWSGAINTLSLIKGNTIFQDTTAQYCIEFTTTASGVISGNHLYSDVYGSMLDPGSMICIDNWGTDLLDMASIAIPVMAESSDVAEDGDGSDLERMEYLQNKSDDILAGLRMTGGTIGDVFYVDSVTGSAVGGTSWELAEATLALGYAKATANKGDVIFVACNHSETIVTGSPVTLATADVTVIGIGEGDEMPLITFSGINSSININAATNILDNLNFYSSVADTTIGLDVKDAGDGAIIRNCTFTNASGFEFLSAIAVNASADRVTIENNLFVNTGGSEATEAIQTTLGVVNRLTIVGNRIYGKYDAAGIYGDDIDTLCLIKDNIIYNEESGIHAIEFTAAATGELINNMLGSDTYGAVLDPGSLRCYGNMQTVGIDAAAEDVPLVAGKSYSRVKTAGDLNANDELFLVTGSPIVITSLVGFCDVASGGATTLNIQVDATDAGKDYDLSTDVDITTVDAGGWIVFDPSILEAATTPAPIGATGCAAMPLNWPVALGIIESDVSAGGDTGEITWYMVFTPVGPGCEVVAK